VHVTALVDLADVAGDEEASLRNSALVFSGIRQ